MHGSIDYKNCFQSKILDSNCEIGPGDGSAYSNDELEFTFWQLDILLGKYELYKLGYKYRSSGLGVGVDSERLQFPSLCGQNVFLVGLPAGLFLVLAAVSSGGFEGGRVILHLGATEFRHSWGDSLNSSDIITTAFYPFEWF